MGFEVHTWGIKMRTLDFAAIFALSAISPSFAATLTGDDVSVNLGIFNLGATVVSGTYDASFVNQVTFDFDAGAASDEFVMAVHPDIFSPVSGTFGRTSFTLESLDFSMGHTLVGFEILHSEFDNLVATVIGNTLTFTYTDGFLHTLYAGDIIIWGRFLTRPSQIPLPAAFPLMVAGLGGIGLFSRRRKKA